MKYPITLLITLALSIQMFGQDKAYKMKPVFNGKTLKHWTVPENNIWWSVDAGTLWAKSDPDQIGSILWSDETYTDFVVQLEFKFGQGTVDSGIFMRGDDEKNPQIQIGISGSLKRDMTGSPYVPKLGYPQEADGIKELLKIDDWNTMKAMAVGNLYTVWLNGKQVLSYTLDNANLEGPVGLQLHPGKDMSIQFRNIQLARL